MRRRAGCIRAPGSGVRPTMPENAAAKINDAIRSCLEQCYGDKAPLATVADFLRKLRMDPAWSETEIEEVQSTVLKMLSLIAVKPPEV